MENIGRFVFGDMSTSARRKRSSASRRPRNDSQPLADCRGNSSLSSTPQLSDSLSRASSDDNNDLSTNSSRKQRDLNQCSSRASSTSLVDVETAFKISNENLGREPDETPGKDNSEQKITTCAVEGGDNKVKKVKLKVGGITRTIQAKTSVGGSLDGSSSAKFSSSSNATRRRQKLIIQDSSDDGDSSSPGKASSLCGVPWKDFSKSGFSVSKSVPSKGKKSDESISIKQQDKLEPIRKSNRIPKKRVLDEAFDDGNDEELRYLEKLRASKVASDISAECDDDEDGGSRKQLKISKVLKRDSDGRASVGAGAYRLATSGKEAKRSRSGKTSGDTDYEEEELISDGEPETKRQKQRKDLVDVLEDSKKEMVVTTRQRALQTGKDGNSCSGASLIEYPNGLPPAAPRKQKEKLTEVEQQLKKAEAAQRRRMQVEKAARESEAEAIRKILGQDSSRKKREDKVKKRQEELAQERAANATTLASNTVRWVMGPSGTVVIFPNEMGLPGIFEPKACSYPPPREKCVGPSCSKPYKYRDSKSKQPLCSLQCYKAIQEQFHPGMAC